MNERYEAPEETIGIKPGAKFKFTVDNVVREWEVLLLHTGGFKAKTINNIPPLRQKVADFWYK